jgi:tripartite-type tricarboxylate transporter receptor subunit TctC
MTPFFRHVSPRMTRRLGLAGIALACLTAVTAQAQDYPSKPIKIIAPFPVGTGPDANTREIALELSKALGQSVVVENRPGASTMIGMEAGAKAAPDGYTLVMGSTTSMSVLPYTYGSKVPYKVERDFVPISIVGLLNTALTAHPSLPEKNVKELLERLKKQPGTLTAATSGVGSYSHLAGEWFASNAGVKINFVPYNTTSPYADLVAGQVNVIFDALPAAIGNVKAGKLKILALTGKTRHPNFPDVPTFAESGLPDYSPTAWVGLFAPANTPAPIVAKLGEAMQKAAAQNPELIGRWRSYGGELKAQTSAEFAAFLKQDDALWGPAIRKADVRLD